MATTQENRLMSISTPLEFDFLLINSFETTEELSRLFEINVELLHEESEEGTEPTIVDIKRILGQGVSIAITQKDGTLRYFNGIVNHFSQGNRNSRFSFYNATVVPHVWILTQTKQSRIFQHQSVPDILKKVFAGFEVLYELQAEYKPRNYCVQYGETDFDFASRLMEEEGIYFYFENKAETHKLIVADTPQSHIDCPSKNVIPFMLDTTTEEEFVSSIRTWRTDYRLQTGKVTFWSHNFQLPTNKLDATQPSLFNIGDNQQMEVYEYPGGYAKKFDDIDRSGGERSDVANIFADKIRVAERAMEKLDSQYRIIRGSGDCSAMTSGHKFTLANHVDAGEYIVTSVRHKIKQSPTYITGEETVDPYGNTFECIAYGRNSPAYRPLKQTQKPVIQGSQTAIVVGPAGEEIFTDKFGRVKVQFHWDRESQVDADSSCWVRVAQSWAGNKWGTIFIPRIGMEVVVQFLNGDPDQPIVTGCVYNPQTMPPYDLPDEKTKTTVKSDSSKGGGGFNEFRIEDKKGEEQIFVHAQKHLDMRVRRDRRELIGNDRHLIVNRDKRERIKRDEHKIVERDVIEKIERDYHSTIAGKTARVHEGSVSIEIKGDLTEEFSGNSSSGTNGKRTISAQTIVLEAQIGITLKVGGNFITINSGGIFISGTMVMLNSGGAALPGTPGTLVPPLEPEKAHIADNADPGSKAPTYKNQKQQVPSWMKPSFTNPTHNPNSSKNKEKKSWIEILLLDEDDNPVAGERYRVTLPDGQTVSEGTTDNDGYAKVSSIDPGNCKITFPELDGRSWEKK